MINIMALCFYQQNTSEKLAEQQRGVIKTCEPCSKHCHPMNGTLRRVIVAILLATAVAVVYLPVRHCGFVIIADSEHPANPGITSGLSWNTVQWTFTHVVAGNWYPLTMLSHAMDQQLYGPNPAGHHLTNLALHIANTLLLFVLLLRLLPVPKGWTSNVWPSALIAALFGLHPLRVESVAWVAERKDVLSGFFFLLTLWAYTRYAQARNTSQPAAKKIDEQSSQVGAQDGEAPITAPAPIQDSKSKWYLLTLVFFILGLLSKPMLVTLPCLLLLLDFWPLDRFNKDNIRPLVVEKIPLFLLSGVFSVITFVAQKKDSLVIDFATLPLSSRLENAVVSYARYIAKTFWPDSLAAFYPLVKWQMPQVVMATVLFFGISTVALSMARRRPWIFVGWFWFVGLLFPVIGISQVAMQSMADRFTYLPHIGLFILVVWTVLQLPMQTAKVVLNVFCVGVFVLAGVSAHQVGYWKDSEALFRHIIAVTPDNDITEYFMGMALLEKKDPAGARYYFERTLALNPRYSGAYMRLGDILVGERRFAEAEQQYRAAVNAEPNATICNLKLARLLAQKRSVDEAIEHYRIALRNRPEIADAQYQLGQLLNDKHDVAGAIGAWQEAVHVKPDWTDPLNDLAWALATQSDAKLRNGSKAVELANHAAELTHRSAPGILDTLAAAYAEAGRYDEAVATMRDAIQRAQALNAINLVSELQGRLKLYEAKQPYRE